MSSISKVSCMPVTDARPSVGTVPHRRIFSDPFSAYLLYRVLLHGREYAFLEDVSSVPNRGLTIIISTHHYLYISNLRSRLGTY